MKEFKKLATVTRQGAADTSKLDVEGSIRMARTAIEHGMCLSAYLEQVDPTEATDKDGLDAFGRVLKTLNIQTRSIPGAGLFAEVWEDAFNEKGMRRVLGLEWMRREWAKACGMNPSTRDIFLSSDYLPGSAQTPYTEAPGIRDITQVTPDIRLSDIVAVTTPIPNDTYRSIYLEDIDPNAIRYVRVGETGEIPTVLIKTASHIVRLFKFGRGIKESYEVMRRQRLDMIALMTRKMANQVEIDKISQALSTLINGDGNANTSATSYNLTTLDPGTTAGNPTLKAWLKFKMKFRKGYKLRVILGQEDPILGALLISTGSANIPLVVVQGPLGLGNFGVNGLGGAALGGGVGGDVVDDAPANKWVGIDTQQALEHVTEIGATITEQENFASNQTNAIYFTEVEGFSVLDHKATKLADLSA